MALWRVNIRREDIGPHKRICVTCDVSLNRSGLVELIETLQAELVKMDGEE